MIGFVCITIKLLSLQYSRSCVVSVVAMVKVYATIVYTCYGVSLAHLSWVLLSTVLNAQSILSHLILIKKKMCEGLYFPGKNKKFGQGSEAVKGVKKGIRIQNWVSDFRAQVLKHILKFYGQF